MGASIVFVWVAAAEVTHRRCSREWRNAFVHRVVKFEWDPLDTTRTDIIFT